MRSRQNLLRKAEAQATGAGRKCSGCAGDRSQKYVSATFAAQPFA
ncbi:MULTISPECIES: hypothetical protein [unclassified Coleofasciculus]|nr:MULTISPECIES: hypothetical protein [unclassified Coleofasciculus]